MDHKEELLTQDDLNKSILEIVSGIKYIEFKPADSIEDLLILRQPTGEETLWAYFLEKLTLKKSIAEGLPRESELSEELVSKFFSDKDQESLETLNNKIKAYETMVSKGIKGSVVYDQNIEKLTNLKSDLRVLLAKKDLAKQYSADFKSMEEKYYALMSKCVLNTNREPIWATTEEMYNIADLDYLEWLLYTEFIPFIVGRGTKELRYIARSGQWVNRFYAAKHANVSLFSQKAEDLSVDQLALLSWSVFYYDISQMAEEYRPEDDIINNDAKLDSYISDLSKRLKAERFSRKDKAGKGRVNQTKLDAKGHDDVIITAGNRQFVSLHKEGVYSDPKLLSKRATDRGIKTSYNEAALVKEAKRKMRSQQRQSLKNRR